MLKNRTFLGILSIIAAIALVFGVSPIMARVFEGKQNVVILNSPIIQGQIILPENVRVVEMGSYNLPEKAITDPNLVIGKYAVSNLFAGSLVYSDMLSTTFDSSASILRNLKENERAMSITIRNFANGFSGKLIMGDIISIVSVDRDGNATIYDELNYIEILTKMTGTGSEFLDKSLTDFEDGETDLPVTITVILQDNLQALRLAECENTSLHAIFVTRNEENAAEFLKKQLEVIKEIKQEEPPIDEPPTKIPLPDDGYFED
jgi:pilus assembly protein CpaB